jgi:hypothetical protein
MLSGNDLVQLLHQALGEEGVTAGEQIPRDVWDDLMIVAMDIGPTSINSYNRRGEAQRLWRVVEAHGRSGRGHVIFDPEGVAKLGGGPVAAPPALAAVP